MLVAGQDGGLVSALLVWGLEMGRIEGALTSRLSATRTWDGEPFLATTRDEVLEAAGSRYTYAANPLAMREAERRGLKRLALVGMSCQASISRTLAGAAGQQVRPQDRDHPRAALLQVVRLRGL